MKGLNSYMSAPSTAPYDLTQRFYGNVMYVPPSDKVATWQPHNYATTLPFTYVDYASLSFAIAKTLPKNCVVNFR